MVAVEGKKENEKGNEEAGEKEDKATSESVGGEVCTMHLSSQYICIYGWSRGKFGSVKR